MLEPEKDIDSISTVNRRSRSDLNTVTLKLKKKLG
jgi:hypothetical protein